MKKRAKNENNVVRQQIIWVHNIRTDIVYFPEPIHVKCTDPQQDCRPLIINLSHRTFGGRTEACVRVNYLQRLVTSIVIAIV